MTFYDAHPLAVRPLPVTPITGMCLGHDGRIAGGVLVVSVVNGELKEVCSAKVRNLGEKVGQAWRLMSTVKTHPGQHMSTERAKRNGIYKRLKCPRSNKSVREDALEVQDIRERVRMGVVCQ